MSDGIALRNNEENLDSETNLSLSWCNTEVKTSKHVFIWTISNFSICGKKPGEFLESSTFSDSHYDKTKWYLKLSPKVTIPERQYWGIENVDYIALFLKLKSSDENDVAANYKFSILDSTRKPFNVMQGTAIFNSTTEYGFKNFLRCSVLEDKIVELLPDDKLTIYCEIKMKVDLVNISGQNNLKNLKISEDHILKNLETFFESQEFSDIILIVKGKKFNAHKLVLAAHSQIFSAMFKTEMQEKKRNQVEISDVDPDVFEEMLYFIYTGKARNLENMASDLLAVADKYALEKLKIICERMLFLNISIETASDVLILADLHSAEQLKKYAIHYINVHAADVVETTGWKKIINIYPHLLAEIYHASAKQ